jgi:pimeloyl-ACP methyl ester carboxylesterase
MLDTTFVMRTGRKLEVWEYGDEAGHPVFFFHGLIGSHHQASYIADQARRARLRIIAPNRPGVGASEFTRRRNPLDAVGDVEDLAAALKLDEFSLIGISGGTPYALATLHCLAARVRTITIISGMGPMHLAGALSGMDGRRRIVLELGSRSSHAGMWGFQRASDRFKADPHGFLDRLVATWSIADQHVFERKSIRDLFMKDLHQVFTEGIGPATLAQELRIYGDFGFSLRELPSDKRITLWHGLSDNIVPPVMAWKVARALPNCEAHFVPGGHFMAVDFARQIIARLKALLDDPSADAPAVRPAVRLPDS